MKKLIVLIMVLSMLLGVAALAEDTGIQIIGGPAVEAEVVNLDDIKVGQVAIIDGLGEVEIYSAEWTADIRRDDYYFWESGGEAQYLRIDLRILNMNYTAMNYHAMISDIICNYGDGYQFKGWYRQHSSDTSKGLPYYDSKECYDISPLYAGRYMICVTLPNICENTDEPISVSFKINGNEFTYHHRK